MRVFGVEISGFKSIEVFKAFRPLLVISTLYFALKLCPTYVPDMNKAKEATCLDVQRC